MKQIGHLLAFYTALSLLGVYTWQFYYKFMRFIEKNTKVYDLSFFSMLTSADTVRVVLSIS